MRDNRFFGLLTVTLLLLTLPTAAEEIVLKDGTKIVGKIIGVKGETFQVQTSYGEMQVPRSDVVTINFPENQPQSKEKELSPIDETIEGKLYVNRTHKFRLEVPTGWTSILTSLRKTNNDVVAALSSSDETLLVLVTPEKFAGSLASYRALAEIQYQSEFAGYERVSEEEFQLDGRKGLRLVWRGKSKENQAPFKSVVIILPYDGKMLRITCLTIEPLFDEGLPLFEKIIRSYATIE